MLTDIDKKMCILECLLTDYQIKALNDCLSGFGNNEDTINTMLYVWYGMEYDAFVDEMVGGYND